MPEYFLDLKLHDIPNTVQKGLEAIYKLKPILSTVHISGGDDMMRVTTLNRKHKDTRGYNFNKS